jgi:hypothetical protein
MFIKLTGPHGTKFRVNTTKIVSYELYGDGVTMSRVHTVHETLYVKETCEEIDQLFAEGYITVKGRD